MGRDNFHGCEVFDFFGAKLPPEGTANLSQTTVLENELERDKENCVLVLIPPISIRKMLDSPRLDDLRLAEFFDRDENWPEDNPCLNRRGSEWTWCFVRKTPVPDSNEKPWREQLALLGKNDEVPFVRELVYAIIAHYVQTSERLFESDYVRCLEPLSDKVIYVGFPKSGIHLRERDGDFSHPTIGLASVRRITPSNIVL